MVIQRASLILPVTVISLALVACGGGGSGASTSDDRERFREAALDFAECMREHGVDMPDPQPGRGGGIVLSQRGDESDRATMDRAQKACQKHMEKVPPPEISEEDRERMRESALRFARCMRGEGIDMPDPTFSGDGGMRQRIMEDVDPEGPRFRRASEECSKYRPPGPRGEAGP